MRADVGFTGSGTVGRDPKVGVARGTVRPAEVTPVRVSSKRLFSSWVNKLELIFYTVNREFIMSKIQYLTRPRDVGSFRRTLRVDRTTGPVLVGTVIGKVVMFPVDKH